jgi:hypothetical protein
MIATKEGMTRELFEVFGNRKQEGLFAAFVNVKTEEIIPVPIGVEHIEMAARLLHLAPSDIKAHPDVASHLVASYLQIEKSPAGLKIVGILTGVCGTNMGYGVRHERSDLEKAHALMLQFALNGEIPVAAPLKLNRILFEFVKKARAVA